MTTLCIGLMSGTSLDGVDAVLAACEGETPPRTLAGLHRPYPEALRQRVLALCQGEPVTLSELGSVDQALAQAYADTVLALLQAFDTAASAVAVVGCHGQTVHHQPGGALPFTLQLGDPNRVAALTGITVVADFRRRDMALGGQGAPLAPGFHDRVFRHPGRTRVVLNLGGIANVSVLVPGQPCRGWDTGPANLLLDAWAQQHLGEPFDRDGRLAAAGQVDDALLRRLHADPFFRQAPPKSTGREHFHLRWLEAHLQAHGAQQGRTPCAADVQRTLLELTACSVAEAVASAVDTPAAGADLLVCGGGARNPVLMRRLAEQLPGWQVQSTAEQGLAPEWVEAAAFAWMAWCTLRGVPASLPAVTGAQRAALLGGIYPP
jgi:anhydro-N-acetylmuramic acid kinase